MGDLENLVDMGFDREKATLALKKSGNLTSAIDWLDKNSDKTMEELQEEETANEGMPEAGVDAKSLVCDECGKKFRGTAQAEFHATRSGHENFSQSTEEIAPLTEEEKKAKLEELRAKAALRKAGQAAEDKEAQKRNEEIRRKHTKEQDDAKEVLQRKEQIKEAQKKRQEKLDDVAAKKRIRDKIEADKEARRRKAEEEKAMRANPEAFNPGAPNVQAPAVQQTRTTASNAKEARLRLQTEEKGNVMKTFPADSTLFEVAHALSESEGLSVTSFTTNFPKKVFDQSDFGLTLREAGLVPSAALIVR